MKKYKTMFIFLAVLVVLVGVYFLMNVLNKKQEEASEDGYMMTEFTELVAIEYTDGETTMSFVKEEDEWKLAGQTETVLDADAVNAIADELCQIKAVRVLSGADEISAYGLDEPQYTITIEHEEGSETTIYIGGGTGENYYATIGEKVVVYVIESSVVDALEFDMEALQKQEEESE